MKTSTVTNDRAEHGLTEHGIDGHRDAAALAPQHRSR